MNKDERNLILWIINFMVSFYQAIMVTPIWKLLFIPLTTLSLLLIIYGIVTICENEKK